MKTSIRIAQMRVVPEKGNLEVNYKTLMSVLRDVAREDVDVVVTPECFLDGYVATEDSVSRDSIRHYAINPADSPYVNAVSAWARENEAWVVLGCSRLSAEGVTNTALLLDRKGDLVGSYDKTHCQTHDAKFIPGQALPVFDSDFGTFGILICADRRWPEAVRTLAVRGARIIFNPTCGMHGELNRGMMQTRSFESEVFIAFTHPQQSLLTGPKGDIVCDDAGNDAAYSVTEIDLSDVDAVRAGSSAHLRDRRTDLYVNETGDGT